MITLLTTAGIFSCIILLCTSTVFLIATGLRNNSIMDIAYGPIYLVAAFVTSYLTNSFGLGTLLILTLLSFWSTRLSLRILHKNINQPEDFRYAAWREEWMKKGSLYFLLRSYFQIYILQGLVILLVSTPLIIIIANPTLFKLPFVIAGALVWFLGIVIETTADWQLDSFIKRKKAGEESAELMTTGLFRYSRRPNYFGETLIWWGFCIMALPLPFGYLSVLSPLLITYIVTKVTGPMLEEAFAKRYGKEFKKYKEQTSYFFPWFVKK